MNKLIFRCFFAFIILLMASSCGGGGGTNIDGPILSIGEAKAIVMDQFYINGGLDDEYGSRGRFSVYLRDAATGGDVACTAEEDGMEELSTAGIYYGGLSVPFREVEGDHPSESARFQLVFVEQDSEGCPKPIDGEDDIAGISAEFMFDDLLDTRIWALNGRAAALLRAQNTEVKNVRSMAPSLTAGLYIDKLFFDNGSDGQTAARYYIFVDQVENGQSTYQCQVDDDLMGDIQYGGIIYAALGLPVPCFQASDPDFKNIRVRLGLYIQKDSGPKLVGETEAAPIGEIIGERVDFTNGKGYVSFQNVKSTPFSSSVIRLGELAMLQVTSLEYELMPSFNPTVEVHVTAESDSHVIACAGFDQGLTGVDTPGNYTGLQAGLVAADGQRDIFGWEDVKVQLVERTDNLGCPTPLGAEATVLGESGGLTSSDLAAGDVALVNGAGRVTFERIPAEGD